MLLSLTAVPVHGHVACFLGEAKWLVVYQGGRLKLEAACPEFFARLDQASVAPPQPGKVSTFGGPP